MNARKEVGEKTLLCAAGKFIVGGIETYYMRMLRWAHSRGWRTILLLPEKTLIAEEWKSSIEKENVEVWFYTSNLFSVKVFNMQKSGVCLSKGDLSEKTVVCDSLHTYVAASYIAQKQQWKNFDILLYILHPKMSRCSETKIFNLGYRYLVIRKIINNGLIFMDEQTVESFENYYRYRIDKESAILRLGQEIPERYEFRRRNKDRLNILSVCRMDFPFKGYVLGLIDSYKKLKERYSGVELTLVGDGPQYGEVLDRIAELELNKDICLLKTVPYEELDRFVIDSDICVGMGTFLLDAGKHGKIGIIATANQYLPFSCGYLFENPHKVAVFKGEDGWDRYRFEALIEKVLECDEAEFYNWCHKSFEAVKEHYDICIIMEKFTKVRTHKLSRGTLYLTKIYDWIILRLKRFAGIRG